MRSDDSVLDVVCQSGAVSKPRRFALWVVPPLLTMGAAVAAGLAGPEASVTGPHVWLLGVSALLSSLAATAGLSLGGLPRDIKKNLTATYVV